MNDHIGGSKSLRGGSILPRVGSNNLTDLKTHLALVDVTLLTQIIICGMCG